MLGQPKFIDQNYVPGKRSEIERFLFNIFDQEFQNAYRRPLYARPKRYNQYLMESLKMRGSFWYKTYSYQKKILKKLKNTL